MRVRIYKPFIIQSSLSGWDSRCSEMPLWATFSGFIFVLGVTFQSFHCWPNLSCSVKKIFCSKSWLFSSCFNFTFQQPWDPEKSNPKCEKDISLHPLMWRKFVMEMQLRKYVASFERERKKSQYFGKWYKDSEAILKKVLWQLKRGKMVARGKVCWIKFHSFSCTQTEKCFM